MLRPFGPADAEDVQRIVSRHEIADTTLSIPHPYPEGSAEAWIAQHETERREGRGVVFAIVRRSDNRLVGAVGLGVNRQHDHAELGYWIDPAEWNRGYATEAGAAILDFGFAELGLHRIQARHFVRNPQSGRVMEKLGMRREGVQRGSVKKWDRYEDLVVYAILREEWMARIGGNAPRAG